VKNELVQDWMTQDPITVTSETPLPDAHRLMEQGKIRRLPVIDDGKLMGIVTQGDVREASPSDANSLSIFELNYLLANLPVGKFMTPEPITVSSANVIARAAQLMLENKISGLPVVDGDKLVGIITESDIFRMLVADKAA
jgi:CBS domain-containing protein